MNTKTIALLAIVGGFLLIVAATFGESKPDKYKMCMSKQTTHAAQVSLCVQTKLKAKGYADGVTCIALPQPTDRATCDDTTRYNAEVEARNECIKNIPPAPTTIECLDMLK